MDFRKLITSIISSPKASHLKALVLISLLSCMGCKNNKEDSTNQELVTKDSTNQEGIMKDSSELKRESDIKRQKKLLSTLEHCDCIDTSINSNEKSIISTECLMDLEKLMRDDVSEELLSGQTVSYNTSTIKAK